jgi:hypothetical protein
VGTASERVSGRRKLHRPENECFWCHPEPAKRLGMTRWIT